MASEKEPGLLKKKIRPLILAAGLGTRLLPRTCFLPKPLLPVAGRPLLWYSINALRESRLSPPIIVVSHLENQIRSFFSSYPATFLSLPNCTMAEEVLLATSRESSRAFIGMNGDVLMPKCAVSLILNFYCQNKYRDCVLFTKLDRQGHKSWRVKIQNGFLRDITLVNERTNFERVLVIFNATSLRAIDRRLQRPIKLDTIPSHLSPFGTGWNLLLKVLLELDIPVAAKVVQLPIWNVNVPHDFDLAEHLALRQPELYSCANP